MTGAFSKAVYLVCNYAPAGNVVGVKPFSTGASCSRCASGLGWCSDGLCNRECTRASRQCYCAAVCYNCASLTQSNCQCSCADGWYSTDCSLRCDDTHQYCGASPGWPASWCDRSYVRRGCPAMCQLCRADPDAKEGQCDPVYGSGAHFSAASRLINSLILVKSLTSVMVVITVIVSPL